MHLVQRKKRFIDSLTSHQIIEGLLIKMSKMSITPYPLIINPPNNLLKKYMSIFGVLRTRGTQDYREKSLYQKA